jgi:hypothetical protein
MRFIHAWMPAALCLALGACAADTADENVEELAEQRASLSAQVKPESTYYSVRRDLRRCMYPFCGGYWVSAVNQPRTQCADGNRASECYVVDVALPSGVSLSDGDLVHGKLRLETFPPQATQLGSFDADFAVTPVREASHAGHHFLAFDTGIRCITTPCPSVGLAALNTSARLDGVDFDFGSDAADELEQAFYDEFTTEADAGTGAIAFGALRWHFDWSHYRWSRVLEVENVYVTKAPEGPACVVATESARATAWNFASRAEADAFARGLDARDVQVLDSSCAGASQACTLEYRPVHGTIDALQDACVEHGNACEFRAAIIEAAGDTGKAQGSWSEGPCTDLSACETDDDCKGAFCGYAENRSRVCKPWAQEGERCEGHVLPAYFVRCAPGLVCEYTEPTGDAGGYCRQP